MDRLDQLPAAGLGVSRSRGSPEARRDVAVEGSTTRRVGSNPASMKSAPTSASKASSTQSDDCGRPLIPRWSREGARGRAQARAQSGPGRALGQRGAALAQWTSRPRGRARKLVREDQLQHRIPQELKPLVALQRIALSCRRKGASPQFQEFVAKSDGQAVLEVVAGSGMFTTRRWRSA